MNIKLYHVIAYLGERLHILSFSHKKLIKKSGECHNHKPQPTPDTKSKRKRTEIKQTNAQEANRPATEAFTIGDLSTGVKGYFDWVLLIKCFKMRRLFSAHEAS